MAEFVPRTTRILDLLLGAALALMVLNLLFQTAEGFGSPLVLGVCCLAVVGLWGVRRNNPRARWTGLAMFGVSIVSVHVGDGPPTLPLVFFILMLLVLDYGPWAGAAAILIEAAAAYVGALLLHDSPHEYVLLDTLGGVVFFTFGFLFALMLRESNLQTLAKHKALQERDALNLALQEANQQLRDSIEVEKELLLAEERARSARELHDGLGHRLAVTRMSLEFAERMHARDPQRAMAEVTQARTGLEDAIDEMRVWVRALHPARAQQAAGGFQAVADSFTSTGMDVRFTGRGDPFELSDTHTLYCYRFIQEGLTNVLRHARGDAVDILVDYTWPDLLIQVANTGTRPAGVDESFGLRSLRERAERLGGEFTAEILQVGFSITAHLPRAAAPGTHAPGTPPADVDLTPAGLAPQGDDAGEDTLAHAP